jgi:hypothetical protein
MKEIEAIATLLASRLATYLGSMPFCNALEI